MRTKKPMNKERSVICVNKHGELCVPLKSHSLVINGVGQWEKHKVVPVMDRFYFTQEGIKRL
jgi:hypothetical protein